MKTLTANEIVTIQDFFYYISTTKPSYWFAGKALLRVRDGKLYKREKTDTDATLDEKLAERIGLDAIISAAMKRKLETITPLSIQSAVITLAKWEAEARR
jgi:hypothetical protein